MSRRLDRDHPAEDRRTPTDRLWDAPVALWFILAVVLLLAFAGVVFWMRHRP